jgi:hypothetical protein
MPKNSLSDQEQVSTIIQQLDKSFAEVVEALRQVILSTDAEVGEQVKWNSPSFYFTGEMKPFDPKEYKRDIAVMNLRKGNILLVFPTGATIKDASSLLEGDYKDGRRIAKFADMNDVLAKKEALISAIRSWLAQVEK